MHPPITIVLASYQGAPFLRAQLDSIAAQEDTNWRLIISDDGSTDGTVAIATEFRAARPKQVSIVAGPRAGATRNFLHATQLAPSDGWLAYSDQDDVWLPDKLARARAWLADKDGPAIYAARTTICDEDLNVLVPAPAFPGPFSFRNALIQACLPGNTIVANSAALRLLQHAAPAAEAAGIPSHDWWAYQVLSGAGAEIKRDPAQVLLYRQHAQNAMGRNDTARAKLARLMMLGNGAYKSWLAANQAALEPVAHLLTAENRALLFRFGRAMRRPGVVAASEFIRMGLYRQHFQGTLAVLGVAALGKLRVK